MPDFAKQLEITKAANDRHDTACRKFQATKSDRDLTACNLAYAAKRVQQRRLLKMVEA